VEVLNARSGKLTVVVGSEMAMACFDKILRRKTPLDRAPDGGRSTRLVEPGPRFRRSDDVGCDRRRDLADGWGVKGSLPRSASQPAVP